MKKSTKQAKKAEFHRSIFSGPGPVAMYLAIRPKRKRSKVSATSHLGRVGKVNLSPVSFWQEAFPVALQKFTSTRFSCRRLRTWSWKLPKAELKQILFRVFRMLCAILFLSGCPRGVQKREGQWHQVVPWEQGLQEMEHHPLIPQSGQLEM